VKPKTQKPLRMFVSVALMLLLAACEAVRFRGIPPQATIPLEAVVASPTIAPQLLTPVPTATPSAVPPDVAASPTPTFGLPLPQPTCVSTPQWGLGDVWQNEGVRTRLGCQVSEQLGVQGEEVFFQNGHMLWRPEAGLIYALFAMEQPNGWVALVDTFQPGDADGEPSLTPPAPLAGGAIYDQPRGRFGKLWRDNPHVREKLGWAIKESDQPDALSTFVFTGAVQDFERGLLFWNGKSCFVLRTDDMSWTMY
jgi:hypothetical protein